MRKGDPLEQALEVCHLLDFFLLSSIHSEFQLLYFETKGNTFLFGTSYVHQYTGFYNKCFCQFGMYRIL